VAKKLIIFILFSMMGCASREYTISDLNIPTPELQKIVISSLPVGQNGESKSGRKFVSKYFKKEKGSFVESDSGSKRYFAEITILGDRRPYSIEVQVYLEQKDVGTNYVTKTLDKGMSRVIMRRIQYQLYKRRDDRNVIDDFRVF